MTGPLTFYDLVTEMYVLKGAIPDFIDIKPSSITFLGKPKFYTIRLEDCPTPITVEIYFIEELKSTLPSNEIEQLLYSCLHTLYTRLYEPQSLKLQRFYNYLNKDCS